jgi:predicted hotdog family 3-hydroxylacyl-ACP dehydratase
MIMAFNSGLIEGDELISLVPHKGKMFLLSRVVDYDLSQSRLVAEYDITRDCMFYEERLGGVPTWVSFEFMAQGISALSGLAGREREEKPKIGFILSLSNMEISVPVLPEDSRLIIEVKEDCRIDRVFTFDCRASLADKPAAAAKLTVIEADDIPVPKNS